MMVPCALCWVEGLLGWDFSFTWSKCVFTWLLSSSDLSCIFTALLEWVSHNSHWTEHGPQLHLSHFWVLCTANHSIHLFHCFLQGGYSQGEVYERWLLGIQAMFHFGHCKADNLAATFLHHVFKTGLRSHQKQRELLVLMRVLLFFPSFSF